MGRLATALPAEVEVDARALLDPVTLADLRQRLEGAAGTRRGSPSDPVDATSRVEMF